MQKRYWLRGGVVGAIFYAICFLTAYAFETQNPNSTASGIGLLVVMIFSLPVIPVGFFIGWLYGKIKK